MRSLKRQLGALALALLAPGVARASNHLIAIDEVLGSWQGNEQIQFVELRMLADDQNFLTNGGGAKLVFDDATGTEDGRRVFIFTAPVPAGFQDRRILVATQGLVSLAGVNADFILPAEMLHARAGRVCYVVNPPSDGAGIRDCVSYGDFKGEDLGLGAPLTLAPDNRSLQRTGSTGNMREDWVGQLQPTPTNNAGAGQQLPTLCGDNQISQGEECDGTALSGQTCAGLGFASGTLRCTQCHFDTRRCSFCGNDAINGKEECDGTDLGVKTCTGLGFTGGTLACATDCRVSTTSCDPTFLVPGGGKGPECLAEWRIMNAAGRPGSTGKAPTRQRCREGDSGCDADASVDTCTFTLGVCFARDDARLAVGEKPCRRVSVGSWTLLKPADATILASFTTAVAALGTATTTGSIVTFNPPLAVSEQCTGDVSVVVPRGGRLALRARTTGEGGKPRDDDLLKLSCTR